MRTIVWTFQEKRDSLRAQKRHQGCSKSIKEILYWKELYSNTQWMDLLITYTTRDRTWWPIYKPIEMWLCVIFCASRAISSTDAAAVNHLVWPHLPITTKSLRNIGREIVKRKITTITRKHTQKTHSLVLYSHTHKHNTH